MKRLPPKSRVIKAWQFFRTRGWKLVLTSIWVWMIWSSLQTRADTTLPEVNWCLASADVPAGQLLKPQQVTNQKIQAARLPENAISDCANQQLFQIPLKTDVKAGDILQLSNFNAADVSNQLLQQQLSDQKTIFYLRAEDFHALPNILPAGSHLSIYAKLKNSGEAQLLGQKLEVVTPYPILDTAGQPINSHIGLAVDADLALSLTKVLTDGWELYGVIEQ